MIKTSPLKLNVLVSTIDEGILNVENLLMKPRNGLRYIISHQYTHEKFRAIPPFLERPDVTISQLYGKGLSKSRNNALRLATADVALIADDDARYCSDYIDTIIASFSKPTSPDVALFKIKTGPGEPEYKQYPRSEVEIGSKRHFISSLEIVFNVSAVRNLNITFDERFGAGQKYIINSEETVFIDDCLKNGLKVIFYPEYIVEHPYVSRANSISIYDKQRVWVEGAYDCRKNGPIAIPKALFGTIKNLPDILKHRANPFTYFYHRLSAVFYILKTNKR